MPKQPAGKLREVVDAKPWMKLFITGRTVVFSESDPDRIRQVHLDTGVETKPLPIAGLRLNVADGAIVREHRNGRFQVIDLGGKVKTTLASPKKTFLLEASSIDSAGRFVGGVRVYDAFVWNARTGKIVFQHTSKRGLDDTFVSPDGAYVAITRVKQPLTIVTTKDWSISTIPDAKLKSSCAEVWLPGNRLALYSYTDVVVCDLKTKQVIAQFKLNHGNGAVYVPKHEVFLVGGYKRLSVWDAKTWKPRGAIEIPVDLIATTKTGDRIVTSTDDAPLVVWNTAALLGATKQPVAKPKSKKPAKRSVRAVFFGVPAEVPAKKIIDAVGSLHYILDSQPPDFAVRVLHAKDGRDRHWFHVVGTRGRNYLLEPWIECLQTDLKTPLDVVLHIGIFKKIEARRYENPFKSTPIKVKPDYLAALDVPHPVLVIADGKPAIKRVTPRDISVLVGCVELAWPR